MSSVTYFVAQPFETTKKGRIIAGIAQQAQTADQAIRHAERMAREKGGAVAFSRTGDPAFGEFEDAVILGKFGELPDDLAFG